MTLQLHLFFFFAVTVGLFSRSLGEDCPECQFLCGNAGVADCATCLCEPSCEVSPNSVWEIKLSPFPIEDEEDLIRILLGKYLHTGIIYVYIGTWK